MKALSQFAQKRFKRLRKYLKHFPAEGGKEELHQIRVEIKKIKALLRLIHYHDKNFHDHKNYIPFRIIFREAGKIREVGLRKELLEQYTQIHVPFYQSPNRLQTKFIQSTPTHIRLIKKHQKALLKKIDLIKASTYHQYLKKKKRELTKKLRPDFKQHDLHLLRKLIKEITYLSQITIRKNKIEPFLIESASMIGQWHDKKILIPWIRKNVPQASETINRLKLESNSELKQVRLLIRNR
jgi:CHAD domain-containing protein